MINLYINYFDYHVINQLIKLKIPIDFYTLGAKQQKQNTLFANVC